MSEKHPTMRKLMVLVLVVGSLALPGARAATVLDHRVIVSSTLDDELQIFGASSLTELQSPVLSRGGGPVRMYVQTFGGKTYLFAANHGVQGSLGVFDLSGSQVSEAPLSPFPARPGSVGVAAGMWGTTPVVFVTNTVQALGGCGMPKGSVTAYDATDLPTTGLITAIDTLDTAGALPYAVAADGGLAFVSSNCSDTLETFSVGPPPAPPLGKQFTWLDRRATGDGPDGVIFDPVTHLIFVNNISGSSVSVFSATSPGALTTVPLPGAHPIDSNLADSPGGHHWLVTSNGGDDSVSLIDRDVVAACIAAAQASCPQAESAHIRTGVAGGAPEGIDYDPATNRIFTVNKTPYAAPSLSVIQIDETDLTLSKPVAKLALTAGPVPAFTAFDVVVQK